MPGDRWTQQFVTAADFASFKPIMGNRFRHRQYLNRCDRPPAFPIIMTIPGFGTGKIAVENLIGAM
jgi:hypothetical protein